MAAAAPALATVSRGQARSRAHRLHAVPAHADVRHARRGRPAAAGPAGRLAYYPGPRDGHFGTDTLEAVWAFQEAQRIPVTGQIGPRTQWRLAHPSAIRPLIRNGPALRVKVNLTHRVLYVYHRHHVVLVSHISSGGGYYYCSAGSCSYAITPTGNFRHPLAGARLARGAAGPAVQPGLLRRRVRHSRRHRRYPLQPVSHGCVRIPMDVANIFPGLVPREGIPVYIRG